MLSGSRQNNFRPKCFFSIGESGLGKSTLVDSLFLTSLYNDRKVPAAIGMCLVCFHPLNHFFCLCFKSVKSLRVYRKRDSTFLDSDSQIIS